MRKWLITIIFLLFIICIDVFYLWETHQNRIKNISKSQQVLLQKMNSIERQTNLLVIKLVSLKERIRTPNKATYTPVFVDQSAKDTSYFKIFNHLLASAD